MKLTPFGQQLQHFQKRGELKAVARESMTQEQMEEAEELFDFFFKRTREEDNDYRDYDPLPNRILKWAQGSMVGARYKVARAERELDRIDVYYRERNVFQARRTPDSLTVFKSFSHPDVPTSVWCWNVDYQHPERSFYQETSLPADPWKS